MVTVTLAQRLHFVRAVLAGELQQNRAAELLDISDRQMRRVIRRYQIEGAAGLISRRCNRPSNHRLPEALCARVLGLLRAHYADLGPTLARQRLRAEHSIVLSVETVRTLMTGAGFWIPHRSRPAKTPPPRRRSACVGQLIQINGGVHPWFAQRGPLCTVLVYVDDATGRLMEVLFLSAASTFGYFAATRAYVEKYGKPLAFHSAQVALFQLHQPKTGSGAGATQFGRALYELNIEGVCANTPADQKRVDRAHKTMQTRLMTALRRGGVSTIAGANALMPAYMDAHNRRYAKSPRELRDAHRVLRQDEDMDAIFTARVARKVSQNLTVDYETNCYLIADTPAHQLLAGKYLEVYAYPAGGIELRASGRSIAYTIRGPHSEAVPRPLVGWVAPH